MVPEQEMISKIKELKQRMELVMQVRSLRILAKIFKVLEVIFFYMKSFIFMAVSSSSLISKIFKSYVQFF